MSVAVSLFSIGSKSASFEFVLSHLGFACWSCSDAMVGLPWGCHGVAVVPLVVDL